MNRDHWLHDEPVGNHARKYVELLRLTESGPVVVWLVAAQARWATVATRVDSHICFQPAGGVDHATVVALAGARLPQLRRRSLHLTANLAHALNVCRLTEFDGQQRCYEFPWRDERQLDRFVLELRQELHLYDLAHARPWKWRAETSGGSALSPSGRTTGLELRYSYYA
jgi:hypothetical protein